MDEDQPPCLKRFGFLPIEKAKKIKNRRKISRQKSERYYVQDTQGVYLTTREAEVSWMMSKGYTIQESALKMDLSPRTVEFYLGNVRRKLGVRNKHELLRVLYDNNFFESALKFDDNIDWTDTKR